MVSHGAALENRYVCSHKSVDTHPDMTLDMPGRKIQTANEIH